MFTSEDDIATTVNVRVAGVPDRPRLEALLGALHSSPYLPLRTVECTDQGGVLKLQGCVPSYYLKQLAQSLALSVNSSWLVQNEIEVVTPGNRFSLRGACCGSSLSEPRRPR
ncbi:MAG: BON domain-containing protein [Planctomycetes bacterium]|nr:BON domain-containing protein [Planctomycetota bacterium]